MVIDDISFYNKIISEAICEPRPGSDVHAEVKRIVASDGLWDIMSNQEVCEIARKRILMRHKKYGATPLAERGKGMDTACQAAPEYLSVLALQKGSKVDVSIIVICD
ncbi:unnamed protein product [Brassica napus]|nr:unnamed protein product [Brassica napus]